MTLIQFMIMESIVLMITISTTVIFLISFATINYFLKLSIKNEDKKIFISLISSTIILIICMLLIVVNFSILKSFIYVI